ncbi:MAG: antA/AntB antirepressor family protein [Candidatus Moranbacteria bacterium]|jgi:anti-repressor protein|nr:antA/AntB antirepressor family protein [Candidatus Moranbacteria bacterium]
MKKQDKNTVKIKPKMNDLINIKVIQKNFNGEKKRFVNACELHSWLGGGKFFVNWIKDRIEKYDFIENLDYFVSIANFGNGKSGSNKGKIKDQKTSIAVKRICEG